MKRSNPLFGTLPMLLACMLLAPGAALAQAAPQPDPAASSATAAHPAATTGVIRVAWDRVGSAA